MIVATTTNVARARALPGSSPHPAKRAATGSANTVSPTMPLRMPIEVMPICTVDMKRVGSCPNASAAAAPLSPRSARACRRERRAVTSAISDIENSPLRTIRAPRMAISMRTPQSNPGEHLRRQHHATGARLADYSRGRGLWSGRKLRSRDDLAPWIAPFYPIDLLEHLQKFHDD
ncbi:MAG TPA: hypothetical protein PKO41_04000 [Dokdonella sp.]|uniref:hypothetical protein n=1 Tax=Dokdonella sp. TaxID=2291710 RepID=UPI0025C6E59F|nr:hypothetical protein [Dokdonella sp.]HNR91571.1 hypothetical protein [Dokdonella sp.]